MQSFQLPVATTKLKDSLPLLVSSINTVLSNHSGATFPTANLQRGMLCDRTDQGKLYILTDVAAPTWEVLFDYGAGTATTKEYVDTQRDSLLALAGGTMAGNVVYEADNYASTWARGFRYADAGAVVGAIGAYGGAGSFASLHMRVGPTPWANGFGVLVDAGGVDLFGPVVGDSAWSTTGSITCVEAYNTGWWRSTGSVGWFNATHGGGIYMTDTTYVRTYNSKALACTNELLISGNVAQVNLNDTAWGSRFLYHDGGIIGFLTSGGAWAFQCDNSGNVTAVGNVTAYSDERLKTDIERISGALGKVNSLDGVTFTRVDSGERQTGVIAQQVQAVLPEAVSVAAGKDAILSVAYGQMVGLLIEAIKELDAKVDAQARELAELRA